MVGNPNTWWGTHTWWGAHIQGGLARQPASFGGWAGERRGRARDRGPRSPAPPPKLAGCLARPPCMWALHHVWVPHHVFGFPTMYFDQWYQVSGIRSNLCALEKLFFQLLPTILFFNCVQPICRHAVYKCLHTCVSYVPSLAPPTCDLLLGGHAGTHLFFSAHVLRRQLKYVVAEHVCRMAST